MRLTIENIRGFADQHVMDIKPVTLIVGENSSGKTTLMAALAAALQPAFPALDALNSAPFELGTFDTIATYRGGKYGRADHFAIGLSDGKVRTLAKFENYQGIPRLFELLIDNGKQSIEGSPKTGEWRLKDIGENKQPFDIVLSLGPHEDGAFSIGSLTRSMVSKLQVPKKPSDKQSTESTLVRSWETLNLLTRQFWRHSGAMALAPLRSRPHRTYDRLVEEFKPEGDHIPLALSRIFRSEADRELAIAKLLDAFGKESGLFASLKVKRMGRQPSDPFQLRVKSAGPDANLVDVGYGVSQALPIVVDCLLAPARQIVLVQQPEVHLHPRAQAALGTFFSETAATTNKRFVIETHSDYLVDRVRMEVAKGTIPPASVNIVFLERVGLNITVHQLSLDKEGNILEAPPTYREFFLQEEMEMLFGSGNVGDN